jgi:hypothetical protein
MSSDGVRTGGVSVLVCALLAGGETPQGRQASQGLQPLTVPNPFPTRDALEKLVEAPTKPEPSYPVITVPTWRVDLRDRPRAPATASFVIIGTDDQPAGQEGKWRFSHPAC